jgi:hypothetical protein
MVDKELPERKQPKCTPWRAFDQIHMGGVLTLTLLGPLRPKAGLEPALPPCSSGALSLSYVRPKATRLVFHQRLPLSVRERQVNHSPGSLRTTGVREVDGLEVTSPGPLIAHKALEFSVSQFQRVANVPLRHVDCGFVFLGVIQRNL